MRRVVVTGGGIVSALGCQWPDVLASLKRGKNFVRKMSEWEKYTDMNSYLAVPVDFTFPNYARQKVRGMGRIGKLSLAACDAALSEAGIGGDAALLKNGRCGIAFGSSTGSLEPLDALYYFIALNDCKKIDSTTYIKFMPHTCAANLEVYYGMRGRFIPTNTACTSGSMAIGYAYETIKDGYQDLMIAGGGEELAAFDSVVFDVLFAASTKIDTPHLTPRAFDKDRDGLVVGEGAGVLILEDEEHAKKRGAKIIAEVSGFGTNTDGTHITNPNTKTQARSIELALESANVPPDNIGYVNMHGTATKIGDITESNSLYDVFKRAVPVSTIKNYIGHTLGACGAIEAWVTIKMMNEGWFCPNINLTELDECCAPLDYITGSGREINTDYVMSNNFAFGGINTSLIFKRYKEV